MKYGAGARRSHPAKVAAAKPGASHPVVAAALAVGLGASASLMGNVPSRLNQGQTGTCTAHSYTASVTTACPSLGWVPSQCVQYSVTHGIERAATTPPGQPLPPFQDNGAELADAIAAGATYGVCPMQGPTPDGRNSDVWGPIDAPNPNVTQEPDVVRLEAAATTIITGAYHIDPNSPNVSDLVAGAISSGYPIYVGFYVDSAFENLGANDVAQPPNQSDPNGGGHAVFLAAYRTNAAGKREFLLVNSWGTDWADNGTVWVSEAWLAATWELWIMDVLVQKAAA